MILSIILFILIILLVALIIMFLFYILFPAIKEQSKVTEDPVISQNEINYRSEEKPEKIPVTDTRAVVMCNCNKTFSLEPRNFNNDYSCSMIHSVYGTGTDCKFACLGLGDCVKACPQNAIIVENRTAKVTNLCVGCGRCLDICPINLIKLVPVETTEMELCSNCTDDNVTCSCKRKTEKIVWEDKKGFKIWFYCYKIYKKIRK